MAKVYKNSVKAHATKVMLSKKKIKADPVNLKGLSGYAWVYFLEDPIFNDYLFNKFIGKFIKQGKREKVLKIIYSLFGTFHNKKIPFFLFYNLIERIKPGVICVPTRKGKNINLVPMPTSEAKAYRVAVHYLYRAIRDRREAKTLQEKIFNEFEAFFKESGYVNPYWKNNSVNAQENSYMRHFRRFGVY